MGKNYKDQVWCDVVSMDICHILLGRPWKFDRRTTYDGHKNTFTFRMGKSEIVLLPGKKEAAIPKIQQEKGNHCLTLSKFLKESEDIGIMYMLVAKEAGKSTNVSRKVELVLDEFKDVISDELPSGLPPLRDIQHQIDLISGSNLPNKDHYRMSLKEHKELKRQVSKLLEKGYIRESMSSCTDSRAINRITIKYRFPISRVDDMFDRLVSAKVISKIDLRSGYH
ncbi:uncharacterized protein LOC125475776 [Pyrus x bretschneideri]|uniref:uncharacterized protein LOC125475776 n=1 Tax=Pyrus x bretschneideri TaxID=225117 RepID=UPI0020308A33|nr:uncharacterized protein LOC125475776 [Pyrus x bretschneideri]